MNMSISKDLQKIIVLCVAVVVVIGGAWLYTNQGNDTGGDTIACPADAKICPDGTAVGRTGPNCEFAACPGEEVNQPDGAEQEEQVEGSEQTAAWTTYTNGEWKFSFEYPTNYTLTEEADGFKIVVMPPEGFNDSSEWFSVVVIQYPEVEEGESMPESLWHVANYPDGSVAWLKDRRVFDYDDYHIDTEEIVFGKATDRRALKVRETSINPDRGEYRSLVYVLRDPAVYRITHDLASEAAYGDVLMRIEDSFDVLE